MSELKNNPVLLALGGTFDPVHVGHLRAAMEAQMATRATWLKFIPCHIPPHKDTPTANAQQRVDMLQLALEPWFKRLSVNGEALTQSEAELKSELKPGLKVEIDQRELHWDRPSYTLQTLKSLREELPEVSIIWLIGMDSFVNLDSWYQWQSLTDYAHLLVVGRPGDKTPEQGAVYEWARSKYVEPEVLGNPGGCTAGKVALLPAAPLDVSSTRLRQMLVQRRNIDYLVPDSVQAYICAHELYCFAGNNDSRDEGKAK